jgi:hypothetical protein
LLGSISLTLLGSHKQASHIVHAAHTNKLSASSQAARPAGSF